MMLLGVYTCHSAIKQSHFQLRSDYTKFMYQQPLLGIAIYVLFTSTAKLVCAQSLYSMKGLLIGIFFVTQAFSLGLSAGVLEVIQEYVKPEKKCGIWLHTAMARAVIVNMRLLLNAINFEGEMTYWTMNTFNSHSIYTLSLKFPPCHKHWG